SGRLIWSFPFTTAEEFNSRPLLISSLDRGADEEIAAQRASGAWQFGDTFFLMTDALACWTLRVTEAGVDPFPLLQSIETAAAFEIFISEQRAAVDTDGAPTLKNDDVT